LKIGKSQTGVGRGIVEDVNANDDKEEGEGGHADKRKPGSKSDRRPKVPPPTASSSTWYTVLPLASSIASLQPLTPTALTTLQERASTLLTSAQSVPPHSKSSASESTFFQKIITSGTLSDRLSALTLLVQSDPVHNIKALETLKGIAEKSSGGGREVGLKALRCISDWWVGGGAPERKLKSVSFLLCPLSSIPLTSLQVLSGSTSHSP
jgi:ribosome biogenesis protein MAK21